MLYTGCPARMGLGKNSILQFSCSKENVGGSKCKVSCPGGFKLKGINSVTCLPNGMWSYKKKPSCSMWFRFHNRNLNKRLNYN